MIMEPLSIPQHHSPSLREEITTSVTRMETATVFETLILLRLWEVSAVLDLRAFVMSIGLTHVACMLPHSTGLNVKPSLPIFPRIPVGYMRVASDPMTNQAFIYYRSEAGCGDCETRTGTTRRLGRCLHVQGFEATSEKVLRIG